LRAPSAASSNASACISVSFAKAASSSLALLVHPQRL
jgi:hypothetical protein